MKTTKASKPQPPVERTLDGMRTHYDFSKGVRGKHTVPVGAMIVPLDRELAEAFPTPGAVQTALRKLVRGKK